MQNNITTRRSLASLAAYIYSVRGEMETIVGKDEQGYIVLRSDDVINNVIIRALRGEFATCTDITHFTLETYDGTTFYYTASIVRASEITSYKVVGVAKLCVDSYMIDGVASSPIWRVTTYLTVQWTADER